MKKIALLSFCCAAALGAAAQTSLVKDVERQLKSNIEDYPNAANAIKPAFENAETKDSAEPYFLIGKGGMEFYDKKQGLKSIGQDVNEKEMGNAMIDAYKNLLIAIQKDTVVDAKGKTKTKRSKDIIKLVQSHYNDLSNAGVYLWGANDYNGAYEAWDLYTTIPFNPVLGANAPAAPADSTLADMNYNMGLAAWQAERLDDALAAFNKAMSLGYNKKNIYDYAIGVASQKNDEALMAEYAAQAFPLYGSEDDRYIGFMINDKLHNKKFAEAQSMLEQYIQSSPNNPQLYYVLGVVYDTQEMTDKATECYKKAIELNPENPQALMQYGRTIYNKAITEGDAIVDLPTAEYNKVLEEKIFPIFREAATYLEKAYQLDDTLTGALPLLRNIYYNLKDDENLKRIEAIENL